MMRAHRIYLLHPLERYLPGAASWAVEVETLLRQDTSWDEWDLLVPPYDEQNSFPVQPLFVRVLNRPGPVVLVENVQRKAWRNCATGWNLNTAATNHFRFGSDRASPSQSQLASV